MKREPTPGVASHDLLGAIYRGSDGAMTCALCNCEMEWGECSCPGCEDGYYDAYDEDPIFYNPGDIGTCSDCRGKGGNWWCATKDCPTQEGVKVIEPPKASNDPDQRPGRQPKV